MMTESDPSWRPACSVAAIVARAELYRTARRFFDDRGFVETDPPVLSRDTVVDLYLDPIAVPKAAIGVRVADADSTPGPVQLDVYLQTSPEFALKRLLAAGVPAIYTISHAFRAGEIGPLHNVEFSMLEWYRAGDDYEAGVTLLADLATVLLDRGEPAVMTYDEAFETYVGLSGLTASASDYRAVATQRKLAVPDSLSDDLDGWRNVLMAELIQPALGADRPVIVTDYPASQAALAQVSPADARLAERFELFCCGIELANGYHELTDPAVLRRRAEQANALRRAEGRASLSEESRLLAAMEAGLPPSSGCALGLDRALMLRMDADTLDAVTAFPWDRA